jgi:hypothetical protein
MDDRRTDQEALLIDGEWWTVEEMPTTGCECEGMQGTCPREATVSISCWSPEGSGYRELCGECLREMRGESDA